eukprot:COSAG02_NODE_4269_length_5565_cov_34.802964_2_plen_1281_part_00
MSSHITTGRPTRSGELRASDDMVDHRGSEVAEEGFYSANRIKTPAQLEQLRRTVEALRQDVVDAAAELAQAGPDHQTYLAYQLQLKRGRARRYERLFNVNFSVTEEEMQLADIFHGRGESTRTSERERLEGLRVFQLRNELRERGLDQQGTPAEMVERLLAVSNEGLADDEITPTTPHTCHWYGYEYTAIPEPKPPASSSVRASMELVRRSGSAAINPVASSPRWWPAGGAAEPVGGSTEDEPERDETGKLIIQGAPKVAEHNVHLRNEIRKLQTKVNRLKNSVEQNDHPELRLSLEASQQKLEALENRQKTRFMHRGHAKKMAQQQPKAPDAVSFGSAKDRGLSTPRTVSPRMGPKDQVKHQKEAANTLSSEIAHKQRKKAPTAGSLGPRGFGTQSPTFRGQFAFGVPWGTSAENRPSMLPPSDIIVATADGSHQIISAVVGAGGTGQLAPVGLGWKQYYRLLRDRSFTPGARPMKASQIPEDPQHRKTPKGTIYKETSVRQDPDASLWRLQDGAPAGQKALNAGVYKVHAGNTFAVKDYFDLTMECQCATQERSGTRTERLLQLLHSNQEKMPCPPGCCRIAGVGVRERIGMLMRDNGTPREPPVYFAQYTLLKRKPSSVPKRQKERTSSPQSNPITNIRLSVTDAAAAEDKPYTFDANDFEEEDEKTRTTLFHLAAESHASGMRSSTRQEEQRELSNGQVVRGIIPDRAPQCADMAIHAGSGRFNVTTLEDDGKPRSFQDHRDPFYPQAVCGNPASNPDDMKIARTFYQYTKSARERPQHLRHRHHRPAGERTGERPNESRAKNVENDPGLGVAVDDAGVPARKCGSIPVGSSTATKHQTTATADDAPSGSIAHTVWKSSDYIPQDAFDTGMFRFACDMKFDEIRKHMWAQTFAIGSDDMADLFDMYDRNSDGALDRTEFRGAIRRSRVSSKELSDEAIHALFDSIDANGDGLVSATEFRDFMETKGIEGVKAVPTIPKSRPRRMQPQVVDEKLRKLMQTYHQKQQQRSSGLTRIRGDGPSGGSAPVRRQKSVPSAPVHAAGSDRGAVLRLKSYDGRLESSNESDALDAPHELHPAGYARVFATELADSPRGLAPHVITPQMALTLPEERKKSQRGAKNYREKQQKNRAAHNMVTTDTDGTNVATDEKILVSVVGGPPASNTEPMDSQRSRSLGCAVCSIDSARSDGVSFSVTFADAESSSTTRETATANAVGSDEEDQDLPLSLDSSLQQGMIEYVSDLRELLAAQLITQDEFTQWVLRKAGGAMLEEQLREIEGE